MTAIMSYQYPLPTSRPDLEVSSAGLVNNFHLPPVVPPDHSQIPSKADSPLQNRGTPILNKNSKMKRSSSTPNVRAQTTPDSGPGALSAEKRRNKLGYHRTSVACGHCRRRKIRCIPAAGDPQNRCSNCIRLKKECNFFPVDQQAQTDSRNQRDSQSHSGPGRTSSVSPTNSSSHPAEMQNGLPYQHLTMPPIQDLGNSQMKRPRNDGFSPESKGWTRKLLSSASPLYRANTFSQPEEFSNNNAGWVQSDHAAMAKGPSDVSSTYWRGQESPLTPAFSPYPPNIQMTHQPNWPPPATEQSPREELGWSVPQRSMSYGNVEGMPHHTNYPSFPPPPSSQPSSREDFTPRQTPQQHEAYLSTMPTTTSATAGSAATSQPTPATDHASHPSTAPASQYPIAQNWQQPYAYSKAPMPAAPDGYAGWYGQNPTLPSQPHPAGNEQMSAPGYTHGEPYGGIYYNNTPQGRQ